MDKIMEFLDMRVAFLKGFGEDEVETFDAVFIRKKIKEILNNQNQQYVEIKI